MEMFLMIATMSVLGVIVCALLFAAAARQPLPRASVQPTEAVTAAAPRFFVDLEIDAKAVRSQVPVEVLLLQLERHVRLEQVAAESFQFTPTPEALHMITMSPLVH